MRNLLQVLLVLVVFFLFAHPAQLAAVEDDQVVKLVKDGQIKTLQLLILDAEALDEIEDDQNTPLLHLAVNHDHPEVVQWLLQKHVSVNLRDHRKRTALFYAFTGKNEATIKLLLSNGADIHLVDGEEGTNALHCAAQFGDATCIQSMLDLKLDINGTDNSGHTPLHLAAYYSNFATVQALVAAGAQIDPTDTYHETPLFKAVSSYNSWDKETKSKIVQVLLDAGADPGIADNYSRLPSHYADSWSMYYLLAKNTTRFTVECWVALISATILTLVPLLIWRSVAKNNPAQRASASAA